MAVQQTKVTVDVRDELVAAVREIAEQENKTITEVINEALRIRQLAQGHDLLLKDRDNDAVQLVMLG